MRSSLIIASLLSLSATVQGATLFADDFNAGASPLWGNQVGGWVASGGVYDSTAPNNAPSTYSLVNQVFSDFVLDVDINSVRDGGIWLRSDATHDNALVLITGGGFNSYTGLYFHEFSGGNISGPFAAVANLFTPGDNVHIQVAAQGNQIAVYLNGGFVEAITNNNLTSGYVGLYDFSTQTFDNFVVSDGTPEPGTVLLLGTGLAGLWMASRKRQGSLQ